MVAAVVAALGALRQHEPEGRDIADEGKAAIAGRFFEEGQGNYGHIVQDKAQAIFRSADAAFKRERMFKQVSQV